MGGNDARGLPVDRAAGRARSRSIDPDQPDGRPMIVADPPAYAIHYWNGEQLVSHFDTAEEHTVLARYEPALQPLVQMLLAEKQGD
jgi:Icc protein